MGNCKTQNKCECGWIGDDDELRHEVNSDPYGTGDSWYYHTEVFCPKCGSDYIDEVTMCLSCLEVEAEEGYDDCANCREEE